MPGSTASARVAKIRLRSPLSPTIGSILGEKRPRQRCQFTAGPGSWLRPVTYPADTFMSCAVAKKAGTTAEADDFIQRGRIDNETKAAIVENKGKNI